MPLLLKAFGVNLMNIRTIILLLFTVLEVLIAIGGTGFAIYKGVKLNSFWEGLKWFWVAVGILLILKLIEFGVLFMIPV